MKQYTRKLTSETDPLSREKDDDTIMTYFAFRISKFVNFETLVVILKIFKIKFPIRQYTRRHTFDKELFP